MLMSILRPMPMLTPLMLVLTFDVGADAHAQANARTDDAHSADVDAYVDANAIARAHASDFHVADAHANADAYFADALPVSPTVMFMVLMLVPMLILPKLSSNSADTDDHA